MAYAISGIAHWDWPENWPSLFEILVSCLRTESEYAIHGAMRVLIEFTRDLTDVQLPNVGPVILQEMYRIFQSENVNSIMYKNIFCFDLLCRQFHIDYFAVFHQDARSCS